MGSILFSAGAPDYVENIMGMGVTDFGYLMIPLIGFSVTGSIFCTKITERFGEERTMKMQIAVMYVAGILGVVLNYFWRCHRLQYGHERGAPNSDGL